MVKKLLLEVRKPNIFFVTAYYRTDCWAMAVFCHNEEERQAGFGLFAPLFGASGSIRLKEEMELEVPLRSHPTDFAHFHSSTSRPKAGEDTGHTLDNDRPMLNQCIFLRGIRISQKKFGPFNVGTRFEVIPDFSP